MGWFNGCVDVRTILRAMQPRGRDKARFEAYYSTVHSAQHGNETTEVVQRIRASQGHSVNITAEMLGRGRALPAEMPQTMAHGKNARLANSIADQGLMPGGYKGGRNEVYFAELDPMQVTPNDGLPGFRSGSDAIVLVSGPKAAERCVFTRSSTGAYLTENTVHPSLIQAIIDINTREALYWGDWRSMDNELSMAIWNAKTSEVVTGGAQVTPTPHANPGETRVMPRPEERPCPAVSETSIQPPPPLGPPPPPGPPPHLSRPSNTVPPPPPTPPPPTTRPPVRLPSPPASSPSPDKTPTAKIPPPPKRLVPIDEAPNEEAEADWGGNTDEEKEEAAKEEPVVVAREEIISVSRCAGPAERGGGSLAARLADSEERNG